MSRSVPYFEKLNLFQEVIKQYVDFGIIWIEGDLDSLYGCEACIVESEFKKYVKDCFHTTIPLRWDEGFKTVEVNGKKLNATRFSYLKDHPTAFPELEGFRRLISVTEDYSTRVPSPCIICEDRTNYWSDANGMLDDAPKAFEETFKSFQNNKAYNVERVNDNLFYVYSRQKPYWAIYKYTLLN